MLSLLCPWLSTSPHPCTQATWRAPPALACDQRYMRSSPPSSGRVLRVAKTFSAQFHFRSSASSPLRPSISQHVNTQFGRMDAREEAPESWEAYCQTPALARPQLACIPVSAYVYYPKKKKDASLQAIFKQTSQRLAELLPQLAAWALRLEPARRRWFGPTSIRSTRRASSKTLYLKS